MRYTLLGLVFLLVLGANGGGCNNSVVGVQDYGSVSGRVLDATTNAPIPQAYVSVGSLFVSVADKHGGFVIGRVPVGDQEVDARSPGYATAGTTVTILKDQTASAGFIRLVPVAKPANQPTLPPPATPSPAPSETPAAVGSPSPAVAPVTAPPGAASPSPVPSASPAASPAR